MMQAGRAANGMGGGDSKAAAVGVPGTHGGSGVERPGRRWPQVRVAAARRVSAVWCAAIAVGVASPVMAQAPARTGAAASERPSPASPVAAAAAARPRPPACPAGTPTALVLSGGGAKGLAHLGLLRALDSLGAVPDMVVGASMGAIVGSLYASGLDAREIERLARSLPLDRVFNTFEPSAPRELGRLQPLVTWEDGAKGIGIQTTAVKDEVVNGIASQALLRGNLLAQGDFDRLPIPFRAVATDLRTRDPVALRGGDLGEAVRASFAIPLVFRPETIDGVVLADGGLSANIPIALARRELAARAGGAPVRVLVSDVSERVAPDSADLSAVVGVADRLINFLFLQPLDSLGPGDLFVRTALPRTPSLDFSPANVERILAAGRAAADSMITRAECLPYAAPRPRSLPTRLTGVTLTDLAAERLLDLRTPDTLDVELLRARLRRFERDPRFRALWLQPRPAGEDAVQLAPLARRTPRRSGHVGLMYDSDFGGRMWIGSLDRDLLRTGASAAGVLLLGERQRELRASVRKPLGLGAYAPRPLAVLRIADEEIRTFNADGDEFPSLGVKEATTLLGLELPLDGAWSLQAGAYGRWWREPDRGDDDALGALVRVERFGGFTEPYLMAEGVATAAFRRALLDLRWRIPAGGGLRLWPRIRVMAGDSLPLALRTPLGGLEEGFPGYKFGERRGDREVFVGLGADRRIAGPLFLRLEAAVGRTAEGGALLRRGPDWDAGVRGGLGLETVLGPIRLEYGAAVDGRSAVFVRFGRWIPQPQ